MSGQISRGLPKKQESESAPVTIPYTPEELERLKTALDRKLGPEFISIRSGPGQSKVNYLEGWKAINLANEIFGPTGWRSELRSFQVDYIDERNGRVSLGLSSIVRVILRDGTYHEDIGYGSIDNCNSKSAAFDKCKKEAATDGMKRALRQFGNSLGNCLYDKDYLKRICKVKPIPLTFDEDELMRHEEKPKAMSLKEPERKPMVAVKPQSHSMPTLKTSDPAEDHDNSFNDFMSDDWPDELVKTKRDALPDSEPEFDDDDDDFEPRSLQPPAPRGRELKTGKSQELLREADSSKSSTSVARKLDLSSPSATPGGIPDKVVFVSAKAADRVKRDPSLQNGSKYDARNTPDSLKKSSFVNHNKSTPIKRSLVLDEKENTVPSSVKRGNWGK
ncbi:hypothetical protein KL909_004680 [Ogataea angusta]|nr:hypothetical protein KL909_004680 [Ogataea angusta]